VKFNRDRAGLLTKLRQCERTFDRKGLAAAAEAEEVLDVKNVKEAQKVRSKSRIPAGVNRQFEELVL